MTLQWKNIEVVSQHGVEEILGPKKTKGQEAEE
jgi:hypothetical protein